MECVRVGAFYGFNSSVDVTSGLLYYGCRMEALSHQRRSAHLWSIPQVAHGGVTKLRSIINLIVLLCGCEHSSVVRALRFDDFILMAPFAF